MKRLAVFSTVLYSLSAWSGEGRTCAEIRCDCQGLNSAALTEVCLAQESSVQAACSNGSPSYYLQCSFAGAKASVESPWNTGGLSDDNFVRLHSIKWGSARNVLANSLRRVESSKSELTLAEVTEDLRQVQGNIDALLELQNQFAEYLFQAGEEANALASWSVFSTLSQSSAEALDLMAKALKPAENSGKKARMLALEIKNVEANLYEQAAYAAGKAGNFDESAKLWKTSASLAAKLVGEAEQLENNELVDRLRYEQSTRLLRAKESWSKVSKRD